MQGNPCDQMAFIQCRRFAKRVVTDNEQPFEKVRESWGTVGFEARQMQPDVVALGSKIKFKAGESSQVGIATSKPLCGREMITFWVNIFCLLFDIFEQAFKQVTRCSGHNSCCTNLVSSIESTVSRNYSLKQLRTLFFAEYYMPYARDAGDLLDWVAVDAGRPWFPLPYPATL